MIRRPPRSTLFPSRRSSDLVNQVIDAALDAAADVDHDPVKARLLRGSTQRDRKSTRLNSSHTVISYAVFCLKKKKTTYDRGACRVSRWEHSAIITVADNTAH